MKKEEKLNNILKEIKEVKIQGAENIAIEGIKAFLLMQDKKSADKIISQRPTEPLLQNCLKILLKSKNKEESAKLLLGYIKNSHKTLAEHGAELIKNDMNIFTHCHSSSVISILKEAKKQKKRFVVYNTETTPLLQGRKTAEELAKTGIKVIHLSDTAAEFALKKCDLFLFGADAILKRGVINKIGTAMFSEIAHLHNIPTYSCSISLKIANKVDIEQRSGKEVWDEREKNIQVLNPAFDFTEKKLLTGIVSEFGILNFDKFVNKAFDNLNSLI